MENNIDIATPDTTATVNKDDTTSPFSNQSQKDSSPQIKQ